MMRKHVSPSRRRQALQGVQLELLAWDVWQGDRIVASGLSEAEARARVAREFGQGTAMEARPRPRSATIKLQGGGKCLKNANA